MKASSLPTLTLALIAIATLSASAEVIEFSGQLSDNDQPNAGVFDAEVIWGFDPGTNVLTMQIFNQASWPNDYTLSELYFNVSSDVTSMSILSDGPLSNTSLNANSTAGPFGTYGYVFDMGWGNWGLTNGNNVTVSFVVAGANLDTLDFFNGLPSASCHDFSCNIAAVNWTQGPCDDSVYAGSITSCVVPEPATVGFLGPGLAALGLRRRIKRS